MNSANLRMDPATNMKPPSLRWTRARLRLLKWAALPLAILLATLGAITLPLPIPTGIVLIALGLAVAAFNPRLKRWIRRTRARFPVTNGKIRRITPRLPGFIRRALQRTDARNGDPNS
ncbi:hypothetical protein SAMN04488071_2404 [Kordiimonas lacus]|jgi:Flp pilus assembly protein TadB|uniref:Transmembrane protein (PGPGW) n=3 Tax=Kordiimonadaceae TaxID=1331809 RepID=A0A1G7B7Y3_9PROT|nr:hypothetical protein SAMN04488071_2404 [Kordiimonas lacus]